VGFYRTITQGFAITREIFHLSNCTLNKITQFAGFLIHVFKPDDKGDRHLAINSPPSSLFVHV
jgi:hypothetical protein